MLLLPFYVLVMLCCRCFFSAVSFIGTVTDTAIPTPADSKKVFCERCIVTISVSFDRKPSWIILQQEPHWNCRTESGASTCTVCCASQSHYPLSHIKKALSWLLLFIHVDYIARCIVCAAGAGVTPAGDILVPQFGIEDIQNTVKNV